MQVLHPLLQFCLVVGGDSSVDFSNVQRRLSLHCQSLIDIEVHIFAIAIGNYTVVLAGCQQVYRIYTHHGCMLDIQSSGSTAALYMTQYSGTGIDAGYFLNLLCQFCTLRRALFLSC